MSAASPQSVSAGTAANQLQTAADALTNRMNQMSAAAQTGQLKVDPDAARALHKALQDQVDRVDEWLAKGQQLCGPLPFGAQWLGDAMSQKFAGRAEGSEVALLPVLRQYRDAVEQAATAMADTIKDYTGTEESNLQALRKTQR